MRQSDQMLLCWERLYLGEQYRLVSESVPAPHLPAMFPKCGDGYGGVGGVSLSDALLGCNVW